MALTTLYSFKMKLSPEQHRVFVSEWFSIQAEIIERMVLSKQAQGFPDAAAALISVMKQQ